MSCDCDRQRAPLIEILPAENGYIITNYNKSPDSPMSGLMGEIVVGMQGDDPAASFQKAINKINVKESVRRKEIEHHVAKSPEEALKILSEILSMMKG